MFHPHFLRLFFGIPHSTAEAMAFVAASKVEEDLHRTWIEEREGQCTADVGSVNEWRRSGPVG
jgi:hypothetical protein